MFGLVDDGSVWLVSLGIFVPPLYLRFGSGDVVKGGLHPNYSLMEQPCLARIERFIT